jgi:hypothetical protein
MALIAPLDIHLCVYSAFPHSLVAIHVRVGILCLEIAGIWSLVKPLKCISQEDIGSLSPKYRVMNVRKALPLVATVLLSPV